MPGMALMSETYWMPAAESDPVDLVGQRGLDEGGDVALCAEDQQAGVRVDGLGGVVLVLEGHHGHGCAGLERGRGHEGGTGSGSGAKVSASG